MHYIPSVGVFEDGRAFGVRGPCYERPDERTVEAATGAVASRDSAMTGIEREYIEAILGAFEDGDEDDVSAVFAEDGVFIDPEYPNGEYHGPAGVRRALERRSERTTGEARFVVRNFWADGTSCAIEVETHRTATHGSERAFPQVFVVEMENGRIARWQSYLPCSPREEVD